MFDEALDIGLRTKAQSPAIAPPDATHATDEHLVRAVLDGDDQAFAELFERYRRFVAHLVSRFFRDRSQIEECVQQSFAKAYFSLGSFHGGRGNSFPAWIKRISVNVCYDELRRRQHAAEKHFVNIDGEVREFTETAAMEYPSSAETTISAAQLAEKILSSLDARDRMALTLVYSEDYSLNEAAEIIGISSGNLKSRLFRCRNHIRNRFGHLFT